MKVGGELKKLDAADFARQLAGSGVTLRASVPQTPRGLLAVLLPVLIAGLGLIALAGAIPALLVSAPRPRALAQVALLLASLAVAGAIVKRGALSWPGLDAARTPAKLEPK